MSVNSRDPDDRKREIIDVADELFNDQGYENTSVDQIIDRVEVAKGTFYYHFSSKEEVLDAVIERMVYDLREDIGDASKLSGKTPAEKLKRALELYMGFSEGRESHIIRNYPKGYGIVINHKYATLAMERISPLLEDIVLEGIGAGVFETDDPGNAVRFLLSGWNLLYNPGDLFVDAGEYDRKLKATFSIMERLIGARPGALFGGA